MNTGFGATTDSGATNSGFGNTGTNVSGFFNTATGPGAISMSGFGNTASGGTTINGDISGFFNTGVTGPIFGNPSGVYSGFDSGLLNAGTGVAGVFSLTQLLKSL